MNPIVASLLVSPALILVVLGLISSRIVNAKFRQLRSMITLISLCQFLAAASMVIAFIGGLMPVSQATLFSLTGDKSLAFSLYYDGISGLMLTLVSFVGWVICRYSMRYLDGEQGQGRYFRWTSFTIGSVSLLVISGNLLMFVAAWIMTSLGLHQLLTHYNERPAARRAAWTKFTISRLGDVALVAALALIYSQYQTLDFADLFAMVSANTSVDGTAMTLAGFLLVVGAVTKSAQFPFHTWLPQTMETPTPVSALMHAGIVNAGGYLIIRMSPLLALAPAALTLLAIVGAITACYAAVVMLTQTSVKKSLAYSTIAQMGFMMLQCGLGAFSAAMLHILAHSLYKAHAFLSSGSVLSDRKAVSAADASNHSLSWVKFALAGIAVVALFGVSLTLFGINPVTKPGGVLLGGVLCLALIHWVGQVLRTEDTQLLVRSLAISGVLCLLYTASYFTVDKIVAASLPTLAFSELAWISTAIIAAGFGGLFAIHLCLSSTQRPNWMKAFYVHASNGFYLENHLRRMFGSLGSS